MTKKIGNRLRVRERAEIIVAYLMKREVTRSRQVSINFLTENLPFSRPMSK